MQMLKIIHDQLEYELNKINMVELKTSQEEEDFNEKSDSLINQIS